MNFMETNWPLSGCLQKMTSLLYFSTLYNTSSRFTFLHLHTTFKPNTSFIFIEELYPQVSHKNIKSTYPPNMPSQIIKMYFLYSKYITHAHTTNMSLILRGELYLIFTSDSEPNVSLKLKIM